MCLMMLLLGVTDSLYDTTSLYVSDRYDSVYTQCKCSL